MVLFTCRCLNITLHLSKIPVQTKPTEPLGWPDAERGEVLVGVGELGVGGVSKVRFVRIPCCLFDVGIGCPRKLYLEREVHACDL